MENWVGTKKFSHL